MLYDCKFQCGCFRCTFADCVQYVYNGLALHVKLCLGNKVNLMALRGQVTISNGVAIEDQSKVGL